MKKLTLMAIAMGMLAFTACTEKKPAAAPATQAEEVVTDSAFQQAVAGEYKSADGKRIITVNADFTVKTTGLMHFGQPHSCGDGACAGCKVRCDLCGSALYAVGFRSVHAAGEPDEKHRFCGQQRTGKSTGGGTAGEECPVCLCTCRCGDCRL